jgi:hypothetical protein
MPVKNSTLKPLWRGGLPPFGGEAVAKPVREFCLNKCMGLLRSPTGASPLATEARLRGLAQGGYRIDRLTNQRRAFVDEA